jgi:hypothetical protein
MAESPSDAQLFAQEREDLWRDLLLRLERYLVYVRIDDERRRELTETLRSKQALRKRESDGLLATKY